MKFDLGICVCTPAAEKLLAEFSKTTKEFILRHAACDWGDVCEEDSEQNNISVESGEQILSVYNLSDSKSVWVITEGNRSATTILCPEDY